MLECLVVLGEGVGVEETTKQMKQNYQLLKFGSFGGGGGGGNYQTKKWIQVKLTLVHILCEFIWLKLYTVIFALYSLKLLFLPEFT